MSSGPDPSSGELGSPVKSRFRSSLSCCEETEAELLQNKVQLQNRRSNKDESRFSPICLFIVSRLFEEDVNTLSTPSERHTDFWVKSKGNVHPREDFGSMFSSENHQLQAKPWSTRPQIYSVIRHL